MRSTIRYVGLDVHKETISIAVAEDSIVTADGFQPHTVRVEQTSPWSDHLEATLKVVVFDPGIEIKSVEFT